MSATIHRHLRPTPQGRELLPRPPAWTRQALCTRVGTPADWSPNPADQDAVAEAIAVCGQCPVRNLCLEDAIGRPSRTVGTIRGGMTDDQRRSERRRRKRANPAGSGRDTVPALEAVRMVRALAADGHPRAEVSLLAGVSLATVVKLREGTDVTEVVIVERIRAAYDKLRRRRPIETAHTSRARSYAAAQGWAPTAAWVGVDMASPEARPAAPEERAA